MANCYSAELNWGYLGENKLVLEGNCKKCECSLNLKKVTPENYPPMSHLPELPWG